MTGPDKGFAGIDSRLPAVLEALCRACREAFGPELEGVCLHGSLAFGDFCWERSDIDLLAVTRGDPSPAKKEVFLRRVLALDPALPPKGLEFSLLLREDCEKFVHPMPYLLHFSNQHKARCRADPAAFAAAMHGVDPDLAGHITVLRAAGRALWGAPPEQVFSAPGREAFLDSVLQDLPRTERELAQNPPYGILNLCRTLAFVQEGRVLSKLQGGAWALERLPARFGPAIGAAMAFQRGEAEDQFPIPRDFLPWMRQAIRRQTGPESPKGDPSCPR